MNSGLKCTTHTDKARTIAGAYFHLQAPLDTGRKWNVRKTFREHPGHLLNVLCTFNCARGTPIY